MSDNKQNLGLIAGQGQLPLLVANGIKASGGRVCCVGLRDQFDPKLPAMCDEFHQAGIVHLGKWIKLLQRWDINQAIMVGRVAKTRMHDPLKLFRQIPDWRALKLWYRHLKHDHRTPALLTALANELAINGINLIDSTTYIPEHMASPGLMTPNKPSDQQQGDIDFAWPLLQRIVELDIGQSIAVRERDVIAVEAVEGTSALIKRAGELCRAKGWTLLKTSSADHDMRADVPTIGIETIQQLSDAGAGCIALGAGRVILIDKPKVLEAATKAKIAVVGV